MVHQKFEFVELWSELRSPLQPITVDHIDQREKKSFAKYQHADVATRFVIKTQFKCCLVRCHREFRSGKYCTNQCRTHSENFMPIQGYVSMANHLVLSPSETLVPYSIKSHFATLLIKLTPSEQNKRISYFLKCSDKDRKEVKWKTVLWNLTLLLSVEMHSKLSSWLAR